MGSKYHQYIRQAAYNSTMGIVNFGLFKRKDDFDIPFQWILSDKNCRLFGKTLPDRDTPGILAKSTADVDRKAFYLPLISDYQRS